MTPLPNPLPKVQTLRTACHFGEWLQGRLGENGPVGLVTLLPDGTAMAATRTSAHRLAVRTPHTPAAFPLSQHGLRRFLSMLGLPQTGRFRLAPAFPPGLGTGASTAALISIARLAGFRGPPEHLARACVMAEGASDPLMFPAADRLLWASREGRALARLPAVPRAHLLGGFFGPPLATRASDQDYDDVADLVAGWQQASRLQDCAEIATESARRCLARRGPQDDPTAQLARDLGALGWAMSHSGAARALIFAPGTPPAWGAEALREAGLRNLCRLTTGG